MHGFKARIEEKVKELEERLGGLDMDKFKDLKGPTLKLHSGASRSKTAKRTHI